MPAVALEFRTLQGDAPKVLISNQLAVENKWVTIVSQDGALFTPAADTDLAKRFPGGARMIFV